MKKKFKLSIIGVCIGLTASSYAAFGINTNVSTDKITVSAPTPTINESKYVNQLTDLGIKNTDDQTTWSNFVKNCMVPELSADQIISLATGGVAGISSFLKSFVPKQNLMTTVYDKVVSCRNAKPQAQQIVDTVSKEASQTKSSGWFW